MISSSSSSRRSVVSPAPAPSTMGVGLQRGNGRKEQGDAGGAASMHARGQAPTTSQDRDTVGERVAGPRTWDRHWCRCWRLHRRPPPPRGKWAQWHHPPRPPRLPRRRPGPPRPPTRRPPGPPCLLPGSCRREQWCPECCAPSTARGTDRSCPARGQKIEGSRGRQNGGRGQPKTRLMRSGSGGRDNPRGPCAAHPDAALVAPTAASQLRMLGTSHLQHVDDFVLARHLLLGRLQQALHLPQGPCHVHLGLVFDVLCAGTEPYRG